MIQIKKNTIKHTNIFNLRSANFSSNGRKITGQNMQLLSKKISGLFQPELGLQKQGNIAKNVYITI